ncbi:DUF1788 domain-containing protein [[Collinsella] massiliensis]|uniref:DUF1788 domain-containing protein n=1 Tax=[Collinsella] massiliensis TaxID=1232426 RepID=A0A1Y3XSE9_9ACTN|nr:DUF1788 domain-containing protein [[Collinsella] massiliensis]OUN85030.1 hypothetical protein B5G02_09395 [[Collinsella] massiliensis]
MTASESPSITMSFELIRSRLCDPNFLQGKGLGNEVPFFVFPYDAKQEDEVRERTEALLRASRAGEIPARIVRFDLWDIFCSICEYYEAFDDLKRLEERRGASMALQQIKELAMPEDYVRVMAERYEREYGGANPGRDVVLITGVGKVYPFTRAHDILENAQPVLSEVPLVMFYPGVYDGQSLRLFGSIADGNYYRAFTLL